MDKYYEPDLEEFHQGFEYESQQMDGDGYYTNEYCEFEYEIGEKIDLNKVRVKYLSQKDIESLNFVLKSKSIDLWFEREGIYLRDDGYHLNNIKLQYGLHDQRLKITFNYISGEEQIHFEGTIKNKSELKKLLKQLGIG